MVKLCLDKEIEISQTYFGIDSKKYIDILTKKPLEQDKKYKIIIDDKEYNLDSLIQFKINIKDFGAIYLEFEQFSDDKEKDKLLNKIKSLGEKDNYLDKVSGCLEIAKEKALFLLISPNDDVDFNLNKEDISTITILLKEKKENDTTNKDDATSKKIKEVITQVFSIDFPSIAELGAMIKTRHDLVHRNGYKIKNNILIQEDITTSDLLSLIEACDIFVNELTKNLTSSIKKWESEMLDMARNEDNNHGY